MEHRKRSVSSILDEELPSDTLENTNKRLLGNSIDEDIEQYSNYLYSGTFNITQYIFQGIKKLTSEVLCFMCHRRHYQ